MARLAETAARAAGVTAKAREVKAEVSRAVQCCPKSKAAGGTAPKACQDGNSCQRLLELPRVGSHCILASYKSKIRQTRVGYRDGMQLLEKLHSWVSIHFS